MSKNTVSQLTKILAIACCLTLLVGSLAYFTDRVNQTATANTVTAGIQPQQDPDVTPDDPDPDDPFTPPADPDDYLTEWWAYLNSKAIVNFNPGDKMTLSYILVNSGDTAMDIRETFVITSGETLSATPEFRLFNTISKDAAGATDGEAVVADESRIDDTHYKYVVPTYTLSSTSETVDSNPTQLGREYYLVFNKLADNDFQGVTCTIDYVVEAKQHTDPDTAWKDVATGTLTIGGQTINVVPAN